MNAEPLTKTGLVFGESAQAYSQNMFTRLRTLEALCPFSGGVAADLGCGRGAYTQQLVKFFDRVIAADVLPENLDYVRNHVSGSVTFCCAPVEKLPIASASVDAAFLIEVLDHVDDVNQSLREVARILKPGGKAYISVPNAVFPLETHPVKLFGRLFHPRLFPFLNWTPLHSKLATARVFLRRKLCRCCEASGLDVLAHDYVVVPLEYRCNRLRPLLSVVARTHLKAFVGVSIVLVAEKCSLANTGLP